VAAFNAESVPLGDIGVVVGATIKPGEVDLSGLNGPVLAPGFGAQGATTADLKALFGNAAGGDLPGLLPASSRDILRHGPDAAALRRAVETVAELLVRPQENDH